MNWAKLKAQFLASLNHEIRTPLSGVLGMLDLLLETDLTEEQKEYADASRLCAENLLEVLNSTLEFSALVANQIALEEAEFPLRQMLEGLVADNTLRAEVKGLRLRGRLDESVPESVIGDGLRLRQLLIPLVHNAIKFTNQGVVEIHASAIALSDGDILLTIAVKDTGIGIPVDKLDCIFDSFRQLDRGLARKYSGLGLGLAVCRKLAHLMDAELAVSSEPGKGSTFTVHVPLRMARDLKKHGLNGRASRHRILFVDDDTLEEAPMIHVLRRRAYQVEWAASGEEAIEAAKRKEYDLILMDLQMPGMNGLETSARLRSLPAYADVPILAIMPNDSIQTIETYLPPPRAAPG